jgi:pyridoxamine 5'-phosphate oxidase
MSDHNSSPFIPNQRYDFGYGSLNESDVAHPLEFFVQWFNDARNKGVTEADAFTLSTVSANGEPSSRILYLRDFVDGDLVFYTNYQSRKGDDIRANSRIAMNFFWKELERQVKIRGEATIADAVLSDQYFYARPVESRIGAWASQQSRVLASRSELEARVAQVQQQFPDDNVPRPPHWGGYRVKVNYIEFWQGRPGRLHDRLACQRHGNEWVINRLAP